ncbi:hypothetical protein [Thermoflexus sp.]|uniref:hypothetical protein n=1 Tax=Thermoflexus sp. TaxID=1969742 RepID=UPI002ADDC9A5|nr:hypothetical protein [Thermoflexus sp.]
MSSPETSDVLFRYAGLRAYHLEALQDPSRASPSVRRALREGGLIDGSGQLTPVGAFALQRGLAIVEGRFVPPAPILDIRYSPGMGRRLGMSGVEAKLLIFLAREPETCLRFLRLHFGNESLNRLRDLGLIQIPEGFPWEAWSTPVRPTETGVERLREAMESHRTVSGGSHEPILDRSHA